MRQRLIRCVRWTAVAVICTLPLQAAHALPPTQVASQMTLSEDALNEGRYDEAVSRLDELIKNGGLKGQALALAYLNRGIAWQKSGENKKARKDYDAALSREDDLPSAARVKAHYNRGIVFAALGEQEKAVADYDAAIRLDPSYSSAYHNRANLARKVGDHAGAVRDYNAALLTMQGEGRKYSLLGRALSQQQLGNTQAARDDLKQALQIDPELVAARNALKLISPEPQMQIVEASDQDEIVTASLGPTAAASSRQQMIKIASTGGWETIAVKYAASDQPPAVFSEAAPVIRKGPELRNYSVAPRPEIVASIASTAPAAPATPDASSTHAAQPAEHAASPASAYRVQLASLRSQAIAEETWTALQAQTDVLQNRAHQIKRADLGERGIYYRLQVEGFAGFADAKALCSELSSQNIDCLVVR